MVPRNQDLGARYVQCYWWITASKSLHQRARKYMCVGVHVHTHSHIYRHIRYIDIRIYINTHVHVCTHNTYYRFVFISLFVCVYVYSFILISLVPVQHCRVHSSHPFFHICNSFSNNEKPSFHYPQYSYTFVQTRVYGIQFLNS